MARWGFYEQRSLGGFWGDMSARLSMLLRAWRQGRGFAGAGRSALRIIPPRDAVQALEQCLAAPRAEVQLPWKRALLESALAGSDPNRGAWLVERASARAGPWLVTLYRQERILGRRADGAVNSVVEAHLNEVYPPLDDRTPIADLLAFAAARAAEMHSDVLQIHALTPAIERICRDRGLGSRMTKSIYIAADGVDAGTRRLLRDPKRWWCRAFNENQFEEILVGGISQNRSSYLLV